MAITALVEYTGNQIADETALRNAFRLANASSDSNVTIQIEYGWYKLDYFNYGGVVNNDSGGTFLTGVNEDDSQFGDLDINYLTRTGTNSVTIIGVPDTNSPAPYSQSGYEGVIPTRVELNAMGTDRVLQILGNVNVDISNVIFKNGATYYLDYANTPLGFNRNGNFLGTLPSPDPSNFNKGGSILNGTGTLTLTNCEITQSMASGYKDTSPGVVNTGPNNSNNKPYSHILSVAQYATGDSAFGGGIYSSGNLDLKNTNISYSWAAAGDGAYGEDVTFGTAATPGENGQDAYGGGIFLSPGKTLSIEGGSITECQAIGGQGGDGGDGDQTTAPYSAGANGGSGGAAYGGGIYTLNTGNVSLSNTNINNNIAIGGSGKIGGIGGQGGGANGPYRGADGGRGGDAAGGGIYFSNGNGVSQLTVTNVTVANNFVNGGNGGFGGRGGLGLRNSNANGGIGGAGGNGGNVAGGGFYILGKASISGSTIQLNKLNFIGGSGPAVSGSGGNGGAGGAGADGNGGNNNGGNGNIGGTNGIAGLADGGGVYFTSNDQAATFTLQNSSVLNNAINKGSSNTTNRNGQPGWGGKGGKGNLSGKGGNGGTAAAPRTWNFDFTARGGGVYLTSTGTGVQAMASFTDATINYNEVYASEGAGSASGGAAGAKDPLGTAGTAGLALPASPAIGTVVGDIVYSFRGSSAAGGGLFVDNGLSVLINATGSASQFLENKVFGGNGGEGNSGGNNPFGAGAVGKDGGAGGNGRGGAIALRGGSLTISDTTFTRNTATGAQGGVGGAGGQSTASTTASGGKGGDGGYGFGGAISAISGSLNVGQSTVSESMAKGGLGATGKGVGTALGVGGKGGFGVGGAIQISDASAQITNSTLFKNTVQGALGALGSTNGANGQGLGGGIFLKRTTAATGISVTSTNNTIADNKIEFLYDGTSTPTSINGGATQAGPGVYIDAGALNSFIVQNTLFSRNVEAGDATAGDVKGAVVSAGGNIVERVKDSNGFNAAAPYNDLFVTGGAVANINLDTALGANTLSGSATPKTQTLKLLGGSVAINRGKANTLVQDQRGYARSVSVIDVGAFERQLGD